MGAGTVTPSVRSMIFACLLGMTVFWPLWRLSQGSGVVGRDAPSPRPGQLLMDWLTLNLVLQTVVLPLRVTGEWPVNHALWLDGLLISWSLLIGAVVAWGCRGWTRWHRVGAMAACLLLLIGEPALIGLIRMVTGAGLAWDLRVSPLAALWGLTAYQGRTEIGPYRVQILALAAAAVACWGVIAWASPRLDRPGQVGTVEPEND